MKTRTTVLAVSLVLAAVPPAANAAVKTWNKTWAVAAHPNVVVSAGDGDIRVRTGPEGTVSADIRYESHRWGLTFRPGDPVVRLEQTGQEIRITVHEPPTVALFGAISEDFQIEVVVPADCDLSVSNEDGSVTLEQPIRGALDLETEDGRVTLHGGTGRVRISTEDGTVEADNLDGEVAVHTEDGSVSLDGRFDRLDVHGADGRINVLARNGSQMAGAWTLASEDGGLKLAIPRNFKAELDARTQDGRIHFELPVEVAGGLDRHEIRGRLNGGGPKLRLRTADGPLTLTVSD